MKSIKKFISTYVKGMAIFIVVALILFLTAYLGNTTLLDNEAYFIAIIAIFLFTPLGMIHTLDFLLGSEQDEKLQKIKNKSAK